jgi:hypothetical protein
MRLLKLMILNAVVTFSTAYAVVALPSVEKAKTCDKIAIKTEQCKSENGMACLKVLVNAN